MTLRAPLQAGLAGLVLFTICAPALFANPVPKLPKRDLTYLRGVYADTWRCLDYFVSPQTGLPYDSHERKTATSITNIGFYMVSAAIAGKTGLISPADAVSRLKRVLTSLATVEKWRGFPVSWVDADTLKTTEKKF